jgi:ribosomal protein S18 acetylase RimI-like enzyme
VVFDASMADVSVRPARPEDADDIGRVQSACWRSAYAAVLPEDVLADLQPSSIAQGWRAAIDSPPSVRHRVMVANDAAATVGFAAFGPASDDDLDGRSDAELVALIVAPESQRAGHGSRLLAAAIDTLRSDGFRRAYAWLNVTDDVLRDFLHSAGWDADGAHRSLDLRGDEQVVVPQVRLHTDLGEQ